MTVIGYDKNLTAFDQVTVGTKVLAQAGFLEHLTTAIENEHGGDFDSRFLELPRDAFPLVRAGVASLEGLTQDDLHIRKYRDEWGIFANSKKAAIVEGLSCLVYHLDGYTADPEADEEHVSTLRDKGTTHVLVAILAAAGPETPLSSHRLVRNIAGGNKAWTPEALLPGDDVGILNLLTKISREAIKTVGYEKNWIVVADRNID